jgi:hypothetical protein
MPDPTNIDLSISTDQVCFIIVKAREFQVKEAASLPEEASNATDDRMVDVLEDRRDDPVMAEIASFIRAMDEDAQVDLVALLWLGRGDYDASQWNEARAAAQGEHNQRTAEYLLGTPLLAEHLEDALSALGRSCEDVARAHL